MERRITEEEAVLFNLKRTKQLTETKIEEDLGSLQELQKQIQQVWIVVNLKSFKQQNGYLYE